MITNEIFIKTDFIKLDKLLKFSGIAETGGHAKEIVLEGAIKVNGEVCIQRGKKIYPEDVLIIDDNKLLIKKEN